MMKLYISLNDNSSYFNDTTTDNRYRAYCNVWRHDIQHNDTWHIDIQLNETFLNDTELKTTKYNYTRRMLLSIMTITLTTHSIATVQQNATQYDDTKHIGTHRHDIMHINDSQYNATQHNCHPA